MAPIRPFTVDPVLTAIAIGYSNPANTLIADQVLPIVPVMGEQFKWTEYPIASAFTLPETRVGRRGQPNQITFEGLERDGSTEDYGLDTPIPISDIEAARRSRAQKRSTYDPEQNAVMMLTKLMQLRREVRVAATVQNELLYTGDRRIALTGGDRFDQYETSDPLLVLKAAVNATLIYRANTLVMGHAVWQVLSSHPVLVNAVRGNLTNKGIITREELAGLLEIKQVLVGEGYVNTARPGQAPELNRVWGDTIEALYVDPSMNSPMGEVSFGFTAEYGGRVSGRIEDPDIGIYGGFRIRVGGAQREIVAAKDVGAQVVGTLTPA